MNTTRVVSQGSVRIEYLSAGGDKEKCQRGCHNALNQKRKEIRGKYVDHPVYGRLRY